ncbi:hypothetical protein [Sporosarcina sp. YIM B06819]|uniref:hypothetical protein n=1 Tax=Sporosarcina sp. YIM B06819 TaxID=3081769 RepID=UPI00298CD4BC|nr:hypothetical protein [Sporosarcina sp. YIM B06819]
MTVTPKHSSQEIYTYPNNERATTLWYDDHTMGIPRLNVYAGTASFYLIRDFQEQVHSDFHPVTLNDANHVHTSLRYNRFY